ncbi:MAG TPA: FG-GAP-like repeat-containing protein [Bryobacteraceae bacterium]|nr:FG-GAP-like repeat-containing protein [Bryobacteraceae bacterium]
MTSQVGAPAPKITRNKGHLGRRHRRALWSAGLLALACLAGLPVGLAIYRARQPETYKPGEDLPEITHDLDRDAPGSTVSTKIPSGRDSAGGLRNIGRPLPAGAPQPKFTDVTSQTGLASFRSFAGNRSSQLPEDMGSGVAWGDFDNDGNDDLFVVSAGGSLDLPESQRAPSLLFRNLGNGKFQKVENFPDTRIIGMAAAWGDYNNDGWLDLVVTGYNTLSLFRNDHGVLVRDTRFPNLKGFWTGATWGDYDRDGNLDLYVCGYVRYKPGNAGQSSEQFGLEVPFTLNPSSYEPERNLLFHNNGDGTFTEVADKLGVADRAGRSLGALWHDFDGDGWLDLYVANDVSENKLYLNKHGRFVDVSSASWVGEYRGSMGLAAGDWDRDGDDDLFISHWIAQQYALYQSLLAEQKFAAQRSKGAAGSQELHFTDVAEMRGIGQVSLQSIGWGTSFFDFDSDGWLDLVVANGSTFETKQPPRKIEPMPSFLFWNQRGEFFHDLAPWNVALSAPHASRGLAVADYNNDGSLDIAIVDHGEGVRLLRNDIPQGNWLELRLHSRVGRDRRPAGFGDGATAIAYVNGVGLRRSVGSSSYLSQDSRRIHIGLGQAASAEKVEVRWLSGAVDHYDHLASKTIWDLTEGDPVPRRFSPGANSASAQQPSANQVVEFWARQRLAMDALKKENDIPKAVRLFREAVALNPSHEDSRYYLANCLYAEGDTRGALEQLDALIQINPQSHRGYQRKGFMLAATAKSAVPLAAAEQSVRKAQALNPEETGTLLLLGEIDLIKGDQAAAERQLAFAGRTNPKAVGAYFLRGYLAWKNHDLAGARSFLVAAKNARGKDWKPAGSVAEGDVRTRMHAESSVLSTLWESWDGNIDPRTAFQHSDRLIKKLALQGRR